MLLVLTLAISMASTDLFLTLNFQVVRMINPIQQSGGASVTDMRKNKEKKTYEAPQIKDHGTLADLTKGGTGKKTDAGGPPRTKP
jgi:hypothetical protein